MKKYNEEYFSVLDKTTGKKIVDCGEENDALLMVSIDPQNRTYTRSKFLMGPVIDIEIPKALPTNEIVVSKGVNMDQYRNTLVYDSSTGDFCDPRKLPEGQGKPVNL
jgi:hypothetical protein